MKENGLAWRQGKSTERPKEITDVTFDEMRLRGMKSRKQIKGLTFLPKIYIVCIFLNKPQKTLCSGETEIPWKEFTLGGKIPFIWIFFQFPKVSLSSPLPILYFYSHFWKSWQERIQDLRNASQIDSIIIRFWGFPDSSVGKESVCNAGDLGLIPGLGRSLGEGEGYLFQYSCMENSMDCMGSQESRTWLSNFHFLSAIELTP